MTQCVYKNVKIVLANLCIIFLCSQPQCVPVTTSVCPEVFSQLYYIPVAGREESETFDIVTEISDQLDLFCKNALDIYACYFIYPPCDPDRGTCLITPIWLYVIYVYGYYHDI